LIRCQLVVTTSDKNAQLFQVFRCSTKCADSCFHDRYATSFSREGGGILETKRTPAKHNDYLSKMGASVYLRLHTSWHFANGPANGRRGWAVCNA
jgi:hypothetical protein